MQIKCSVLDGKNCGAEELQEINSVLSVCGSAVELTLEALQLTASLEANILFVARDEQCVIRGMAILTRITTFTERYGIINNLYVSDSGSWIVSQITTDILSTVINFGAKCHLANIRIYRRRQHDSQNDPYGKAGFSYNSHSACYESC